MKRLFLLAATAALFATSCEKHEIRNEVINEIGFTSNVGKQTKAINAGTAYDAKQPFTVLAYSNQTIGEGADAVTTTTLVMDKVEVFTNGTTWKANDGKSYFWPNDTRTSMNFYAFSPAIVGAKTATLEGHQKMNGTVITDTDAETTGIQEPTGVNITGYEHNNMYVDFMVADNVTAMKYTEANKGVVPMVFRHKMAQIKFNVRLTSPVEGVTFTLDQITLNDINSTGNVTNGELAVTGTTTATYTIFPATADCPNGAETPKTIGAIVTTEGTTTDNSVSTQPVTMIPQTIFGTDIDKKFTITYSIEGSGVAKETVTKTLSFASAAASWDANKVYIYNLKIGMNEITFEPSVIAWDPTVVSSPDIDVE